MNGVIVLLAAIAGFGIRKSAEQINQERRELLRAEKAKKIQRERVRIERENQKRHDAMWKSFSEIRIDNGEVKEVAVVPRGLRVV